MTNNLKCVLAVLAALLVGLILGHKIGYQRGKRDETNLYLKKLEKWASEEYQLVTNPKPPPAPLFK